MGPRWERVDAPPDEEGPLFMDAELAPHRSLSMPAFRLLLLVVILINVVVGAVFIAQGAFPVAGFLGLDVLALWWAFRVNYRAAASREFVRVGRERIQVSRVDPKGRAKHWTVSPLWARVAQDQAGVTIRSGGGWLRIGAFLPPDERAGFARALENAVWRAKRGG